MSSAAETSAHHGRLLAQWARAGANFNQRPSEKSPDLEKLLLETARVAADDPRLFTMAVTWLSRYGDLVAKHRLIQMIRQELEEEHRPCLGLLLEHVKCLTGADHFSGAIRACAPASAPQPLFAVERNNRALWRLAERRASAISRRWNLWTTEIEPKYDALRPPSWIMRMNPEFRERAALKGDLRATIIEVLRHNPNAGKSEMELAKQTGANRTAVRDALQNLELMTRIRRQVEGKRCRIILHEPASAA